MKTTKIPQYIIDAIYRRASAAKIYFAADNLISEWCDKNNLDIEFIHGHVETLSNPDDAAEYTINEIKNKLRGINI